MFRLVAILGAAIYLAMLVAGRDHGQLRLGLMPAPEAPAGKVLAAAPADPATPAAQPAAPVARPASFVPDQPVMVTPAVEVATVPAGAGAPAPAEPVLRVAYVASRSANLREGPGTDYAVVGRLARGEAVQVVVEGDGPDDWTLVRLEGDGEQGYIASRLLSE